MNARVSKQDCLDIFSTALEGGIGYWSIVTRIVRDDVEYIEVDIVPEYEGQGLDGSEPDFEKTTVRYTDMRKAIEKILKGDIKYTERIARTIRDAEDAGDLDAGDCDLIFQVAALGEVVYG